MRRIVTIGIAVSVLLLSLSFMFAALRLWRKAADEDRDGTVTLRFAHWQLETGVREAFDLLARLYEDEHSHVRIVQMRIPERVFSQWATTQLIGETAPDIIQLVANLDTTMQARHFEPITQFVSAPNPYNRATPLEDVPWRSTFVDGLQSGYNAKLADYYGVPCFFATIRIYYNRDLMRAITGDDGPPANFDAFLNLCRATEVYARNHALALVPIAGSRDNAPLLLDRLFEGVTQKLVHTFNILPTLYPSQDSFFMAYLDGGWDFEHPAIRAGLELLRSVGGHMSPGFLQLRREDALFHFSTGKALMLAAGSWEVTGLQSQARFPLGVFRLPFPEPDHPLYGAHTWGAPAETALGTITGPFGIYRGTRNFDVALDFLRFISSQPAHTKFVSRSNWLPVVAGVPTPAPMVDFEPQLDGALPGVNLRWGVEIKRVTDSHWHTLFTPNGGVDAFIEAVSADFADGVRADLRRRDRRSFVEMGFADPGLEASRQLLLRTPDDLDLQHKFEVMLEAQNARETYYYQMHYRLAEVEQHPAPHPAKAGDP